MLSITMSPTSALPSASFTALSISFSCSSKLYGSEKRMFFTTTTKSSPQICWRRSSDTPSVSMYITLRPARTTFRASCKQKFVLPLPASPCRSVMQPSSTPPPRRSSRAREPRATFIAWTKSPRPLRLRSLRRKERQVGPVVGPHDDRVCGPSLRRGAHGPRLLGLRMDRDDLAGLQVFDLRHEALRVDALRAPHVFRLEAPRLAARQVPQDDERPDRRHLGEGVLVSHHVADMERAQADEGRHAIHLAALLLAEQLRRRGHAPAERLRELAGERLAESVRAQVEIEAAVDLLDPRDEGPRISGPVHAGDHERSHAAHFPRREFAAVATHLQGAFEVPAPLLLARIAERGLDPHADSEVLDGLQVLEPSERLDRQREVVRVLLAGDVRERDAFPRGHLRDRLAKESREREFAVDLRPARFQAEGAAGRAAFDVEDLRRRDDRMLLQEIPGAEALIRRPFGPALDAKHLRRFVRHGAT